MRKVLPLVLLLAFLASACAGASKPDTTVTLEIREFAYSPDLVNARVGEPFTLTLKNEGQIEHDFVVENIDASTVVLQDAGSGGHQGHGAVSEFDVHISALPGETSIIQITVNEPGTYKFICSIEGHLEAGMDGELVVAAE